MTASLPDELDRILPRVQKPVRYNGGEWNAVLKPWSEVRIHMALAFPGMCESGIYGPGAISVRIEREKLLAPRDGTLIPPFAGCEPV